MSETVKNLFPELHAGTEFRLVEGTIARIDEEGRPYVTIGSASEPVMARSTVSYTGSYSRVVGSSVILAVPNGADEAPVVVGLVSTQLVHTPGTQPSESSEDLVLEAANSISLRCGKAEVVVRRNGEIVIRGVQITSRAARSNKIRGGTVLIN